MTSSSSSSLSDRLRKYDTHSSVQKEFRVYTAQGAVLSVLTLVIILYLTLSELKFNFTVIQREHVHVNATSPNGLEMEFDVTFWDVPCAHLSIDANDPTGQAQSLHLDRQHHVWKHRIVVDPNDPSNFKLIGKKTKLELGSTLLSQDDLLEQLPEQRDGAAVDGTDAEPASSCGSCYGAGDPDECCNTCDDVERAYKRKGWLLQSYKEIPQCATKHLQDTLKNEGCNVHGVVALSTGGGNLHLAPSKSAFSESGGNTNDQNALASIMEALLSQMQQWNVSHQIHKLRFGPDYPQAANQLDGQRRLVSDTYGMYQYYLQVVPTTYTFLNGTVLETNQYSVTEHLRHVDFGSMRGLPGIFFFYDVSPLHVQIVETYRKGWIAFLTSVCAVVGGVVTVMGMMDQYLFRTQRGRGGLAT